MAIPTAFITGAGRGIGASCTAKLLLKGYRVIAVSRDIDRLRREAGATHGDRLIPVSADVRDKASLETALSSVPQIDLLVAGAGICQRTPLDGAGVDAVFKHVIDTNLIGVWNTFRAAVGKLSDNSAAVVISSGLGKLGRPGYSAYAASKHGVIGLVKCLSQELAPRGIRVNAVCPGWVDTEMAAEDLRIEAEKTGVTQDEVKKAAVAQIPLGRFVTAEETADLICWLLSGEAAAVTGQSYNISCGEFTL